MRLAKVDLLLTPEGVMLREMPEANGSPVSLVIRLTEGVFSASLENSDGAPMVLSHDRAGPLSIELSGKEGNFHVTFRSEGWIRSRQLALLSP